MGIISKLANLDAGTGRYEKGTNYELGQSLTSTGLFGNGGSDINVLREYSGYVWKCVNVRSEDLAAQSFFVERRVEDKWQKDDLHDFNNVLEGVDGGYDLSELLEAHQVCMDMYGESFWYFSKGETYSKPFGVYLLDPAYMQVYVAGERITGYVYDKEGDHIVMDLDEIAHFRIHNPANRFRGAGPMQKAGWFIRSSRYVTTYINNFLENNAIPAGVIVSKTAVNPEEWKLFKEAWVQKYSNIDNAGKTGFVNGTELDFVKTGLSLGDVDFEKVKNSSRDDILAMFSMPLSKLGQYEDFNKASAYLSDVQFAKSFTQTAVRRITRRLSRKVGVWYGEQYQIGTDFALPEDRELKLAEAKALTNVAVTVNETREAYGFDTLPDKDFDTLPVGQVAPQDDTTAKHLITPKKPLTIRLRTKNTAQGFSYEMKESFRGKTEDIQVKYEKQFIEAQNKVLLDQKERVLAQINPKKVADAQLNPEKEAALMVEAGIGVELALAIEQGDLAAAFVGSADAVFKLTPAMEKYIKDSLTEAALGFNKETLDKIATLLHDGIEAGDSLASIAKEIGKVYDDVTGVKTPGYRLERLTRTEVIKTSNEITEAAYVQSGVVQKKEWFANPGACEFCRSLAKSTISLGSTFVAKGSTLQGADGGTRLNDYEDVNHPPTHPACRCTLIPVVEA